jgi:glycosyltransferase involved in cell wall biosynthesis
MKVLLIHNAYQVQGGEDLVVRAEQEALLSHGVDVRLYSRHNDELKSFGIRDKMLFPVDAIVSPSTRRDLPRLLDAFRPDVAYLHNLYPLISPAVYGVLEAAAVPMVQAIHNYRPFCARADFLLRGEICERCLHGGLWNAVAQKCFHDSRLISGVYAASSWIARRSLGKVSTFLAPGEFVRSKFIEAGVPGDKIVVRPHAIDTQAIQPGAGAGDYALYLGRLGSEKGLHTLLEAFSQTPEIPLRIAGAGPLEAELREIVDRRKLANVSFAGFQSGEAKWRSIENAQFLVFPSECYETFGIPILEGYAKAKPTVGSRVGSVPYLVKDGETGLLFEPGNAADLAAKVRLLFGNPDLCERLGRKGRKVAEERHDPATSFETLIGAFEGAASGERQPVHLRQAELVP